VGKGNGWGESEKRFRGGGRGKEIERKPGGVSMALRKGGSYSGHREGKKTKQLGFSSSSGEIKKLLTKIPLACSSQKKTFRRGRGTKGGLLGS